MGQVMCYECYRLLVHTNTPRVVWNFAKIILCDLRFVSHPRWLIFQEEFTKSSQAMEEIHKLRAQISNIVKTNFPNVDVHFVQALQPPSELQVSMLIKELPYLF